MSTREAEVTAIAVPSGLDKAVATWNGQVQTLIDEAKAIGVIRTDEDERKASEVDQALGEKERVGDWVRMGYADPFNAVVKKINGLFGNGKDIIKVARSGLKQKIAQRFMEKQEEARKAAKAEQERLDKNFKAQAKRAEVAGREAPPPPPQVEAVVTTKVGTSNIRMVWDYEVLDISKVPAQYLEVVPALVKSALVESERQGMELSIPGLRTFKKPSVAS